CLSHLLELLPPSLLTVSLFFFQCSVVHRDLHSFPTRRSSDLFGFCHMNQIDVKQGQDLKRGDVIGVEGNKAGSVGGQVMTHLRLDRKSTRLNSSHVSISYAVFCLKKKKST